MDVEIICKGCKQTINVDAQAMGQKFNCPTCETELKVPAVPIFPDSPYAALFCPPTKTASIEIACAPSSAGKEYDPNWRKHGFSSVYWFQPIYIASRKVIKVKTTGLRETSYREGYNTFTMPEDVVCYYNRYLGTRSRNWESAFFRASNGAMHILHVGKSSDFIPVFMKEFADFHVFMAH
jgi:hypothetical protein